MDDFLKHIETHRDEFYRFVLRTVWDTGCAEDVFSEAVMTAYENRKKFIPGTNFRAWMFRILTNKCFVANRETARTPESLDGVDVTLEALPEIPGYNEMLADPESVLSQCGDEVHRAFRQLSTAERSCILLRGIHRFSYHEIADILQIPVGTVTTHLARGRAKLRKSLVDYAREQGIVRDVIRLVPRENEGSGNCERRRNAS